uniref:Uncharacterized protein n=1 Tax=Arundo donax TaxID=35708 RepID=A0A0A9AJX7_ARUDO
MSIDTFLKLNETEYTDRFSTAGSDI